MIIRAMRREDQNEVVEMMSVFYHSPAVQSNGSPDIYQRNFDNCMDNKAYLEGYVFCEDDCQDMIFGYGMLAKSFSTEFGRPCIWIEDIYCKPEYRGCGYGSSFIRMVKSQYPEHLIRLEAEEDNENAVSVYHKCGFRELPYLELYYL